MPGKSGGDTATGRARALQAQEKREKALQLRLAGASYRRIVAEDVYTNPGTAMREVKKAIANVTKESATEVLALELERLDIALMGIWAAVRSGDVFAIDRMLKIMAQRARYLGLEGAVPDDNTVQVKGALTDFLAGAIQTADALDAAEYNGVQETLQGEIVPEPGTQ